MTVFCDEVILADQVKTADSFLKRLIGLMGRTQLSEGEGLFLKCSAIHCFFMRIPIDAVYISKSMTVLGTQTLSPWSIGKWLKGTTYTLELAAGKAARVSLGAKIRLDGCGRAENME